MIVSVTGPGCSLYSSIIIVGGVFKFPLSFFNLFMSVEEFFDDEFVDELLHVMCVLLPPQMVRGRPTEVLNWMGDATFLFNHFIVLQ